MIQRLAEALRQDFRDALRNWRRRPLVVLAAILTIGLGVGVNTAVFSVVNALVFRPLPVRDPSQLVVVATTRGSALGPVSYADLQNYRDDTRDVIRDMSGYSVGFVGMAADSGTPTRVLATWVTGDYFSMLGIEPAVGRLIQPNEDQPGRIDPVAVLGYSAWQTQFNASEDVVGRRVSINGYPCTIIGVAPQSFRGTFALSDSEVYLPLNWSNAAIASDRSDRSLHTLARLRPGATVRRAQSMLNVVADRLAADYPGTDRGIHVAVFPEPLARPIEENARTNGFAATVMLLLVALVLIMAEVSVTNLLLAQAAARRTELAVRTALGASRSRIIQQQLVEAALLVGCGGAVGLGLGGAVARLLMSLPLPGDEPVRLDFHLDIRVVAYALALTVVTALAIGWISARRALQGDINDALRDQAASARTIVSGHRLGRMLVVGQIGVCLALLVTAGLFWRSLTYAEHASFGFRSGGVLNVQMDVAEAGYNEARGRALFDRIRTNVSAIPGVSGAAFAATTPFGYVRLSNSVDVREESAGRAERILVGMNAVDPGYFRTLGIGLEEGRDFTQRDDGHAPAVGVINRRLADALWPGRDPIGRQFRPGGPDRPLLTVVGVTGTGKYRSLFEAPLPYFYVPSAQEYTSFRVLHLRSDLSVRALAPTVEHRIRALAPNLPLYDVQSMTQALDSGYGLFEVRTTAIFGAILAVISALLAFGGLHALVSFMMVQRTHEIGIRIALGARRSHIVGMVLGEGARLAAVGTSIGLAAALGLAHLLARLLFGVPPLDPFSYGAAALGLSAITLAAAYLPARRAIRVDPISALRSM